MHVLQHGPTRLEVICPPFLTAAFVSLGISLIALAITVFSARRSATMPFIVYTPMIPAILVTAGLATTGARAIFDKNSGTVRIERRSFGVAYSVRSLPLSRLRAASLARGKGTLGVVLVLQDGSIEGLGVLTNQGGQPETVTSINAFLRRH